MRAWVKVFTTYFHNSKYLRRPYQLHDARLDERLS